MSKKLELVSTIVGRAAQDEVRCGVHNQGFLGEVNDDDLDFAGPSWTCFDTRLPQVEKQPPPAA